ncbi:TSUP family transporter [Niabella hirudinis]|uniref:TSUP family transporter n=1 Tax=Niabella hirudinis TaxID=1285929 RepID=UPI003EC0D75A
MTEQQTLTGKATAATGDPMSAAVARPLQPQLLILGGGKTALNQLKQMLQKGLQPGIRLISPEPLPAIRDIADENGLQLLKRNYTMEDLKNADLIIAAADDPDVAGRITADLHRAGKRTIIAGKPELQLLYADALSKEADNRALSVALTTRGQPSIHLPSGSNTENALRGEITYKKIASRALLVFALMLTGHFLFSYLPYDAIKEGARQLYQSFDQSFLVMLLAGFLAQLVDGALGMGYGVTSATILLSAGVNPAAISSSIHTAEMFASGVSGYSHYRFGNVNKKLFRTLLVPGVAGAILGAILLVYLGEKYGSLIRPLLACYTLFLGIKILANAFRSQVRKKKYKHYRLLAGTGGFFDSFGGGGWGPIVTTTLITKGRSPRYVIGSVSLTEFFVTLSSAFTFFILLGLSHWQTILGLIIGGLIAAPIAAKLTGKLPRKTAFLLLGILVILWSIKILAGAFR